MKRSLGQVAFEAFDESSRCFGEFPGRWERLDLPARRSWEDAARAVAEAAAVRDGEERRAQKTVTVEKLEIDVGSKGGDPAIVAKRVHAELARIASAPEKKILRVVSTEVVDAKPYGFGGACNVPGFLSEDDRRLVRHHLGVAHEFIPKGAPVLIAVPSRAAVDPPHVVPNSWNHLHCDGCGLSAFTPDKSGACPLCGTQMSLRAANAIPAPPMVSASPVVLSVAHGKCSRCKRVDGLVSDCGDLVCMSCVGAAGATRTVDPSVHNGRLVCGVCGDVTGPYPWLVGKGRVPHCRGCMDKRLASAASPTQLATPKAEAMPRCSNEGCGAESTHAAAHGCGKCDPCCSGYK